MMLLIFLGTLVIALLAQRHVKRAYARHSRTPTRSGYTWAEVAAEILRQAGIKNVEIVEHEELLGDHYDPRHKRREPSVECRGLDVCGGVYFFTGLFPLALAAIADRKA